MVPMKKILVPTDFSKYAEYALEIAATLAKRFEAEIVVVHMMGLNESFVTRNESNEVPEALYYLKLAEKRFKEFVDKEYLKNLKVTETVYNYKIFTEINDVAVTHNADLIVMGSHGVSGLKEVFVGSNTEKVVRTSSIPVLVVKHRSLNFNPQSGIFACDFLEKNVTAYLEAKNLFNKMGISMKLLYVNLPGSFRSTHEIEKRILKFLERAGEGDKLEILNKVVQYNDYSVEEGVFGYSQVSNADVIALPTQGRQGLAHFFSGSISEDVVNHSDLPVITFKI